MSFHPEGETIAQLTHLVNSGVCTQAEADEFLAELRAKRDRPCVVRLVSLKGGWRR